MPIDFSLLIKYSHWKKDFFVIKLSLYIPKSQHRCGKRSGSQMHARGIRKRTDGYTFSLIPSFSTVASDPANPESSSILLEHSISSLLSCRLLRVARHNPTPLPQLRFLHRFPSPDSVLRKALLPLHFSYYTARESWRFAHTHSISLPSFPPCFSFTSSPLTISFAPRSVFFVLLRRRMRRSRRKLLESYLESSSASRSDGL